ncbi:MAG: AMP-binding protein [Burkholderiales bacterium]|nr:AMP-binding protein [Burkholderiales bacterium]
MYQLTSVQQVVWLDQILNSNAPYYNLGVTLKFDGSIDPVLLEEVINEVANTNEAMRLVMRLEAGVACQQVQPRIDVRVPLVDFSGPDADEQAWKHLRLAFARPFKLYDELLWESQLVRVNASRHYWLLKCHHLVCDGTGIPLIGHAIANAYNRRLRGDTAPLESGPSYLEFLADDQAYLSSPRFQRDKQFWCERFAQLPAPMLASTDRHGPGAPTPSRQVFWTIERPIFDRLKAFSAACECTVAHFMLALLATYFARTYHLDEVVIGLPVHNRSTARQKRTLGMFSSIIPVGIRVDLQRSFIDLLDDVAAELRRCYRHQRFPIADINRNLKLAQVGRKQLFDVTFSLEGFPGDGHLGNVKPASFAMHHGFEQTPLAVFVRDYHRSEDVVVEFNYNTGALQREAVEDAQKRLGLLLKVILEDGSAQQVGALPLLDERDQALLRGFNDTHADYPSDRLIHQLFEDQVRLAPEATAVVFEDRRLSYAELNQHANQLAHTLRQQGMEPGEFVPIVMPRCPEMLIAQLAVLKSGGAYVPIDPDFPVERQLFMIQDCGALRAISAQSTAVQLHTADLAWLVLDAMRHLTVSCSSLDLHVQRDATDAAYVMYTSGSTGQPKGVIIPHRGVNRLVINSGYVDLLPSDCVVHCSNPAFDASTFEVWAALLNGARTLIVPTPTVLQPSLFGSLLAAKGATVLWLTAGLFHQYADALANVFAQLRYLLVGGDVLDPGTIRRVLRENAPQHLLNGYGPTESTTFATTHRIASVDERSSSIPIGRPIANTQIHILDERQKPIPIGWPARFTSPEPAWRWAI